jgi:16S rRNA (cytosine1402-N4)-methyltransferase
MSNTRHTTVLLKEAVESLNLSPEDTVIDATAGAGGHSRAILEKLGEEGTLLALDADAAAIRPLSEAWGSRVKTAVGNFRDITTLAEGAGITTADAILADLGWRMEQFGGSVEEGGGKGFSFSSDEPLHMTYGNPEDYSLTAADIVNDWDEESLANVLFGYGEERQARRIARAIVAARKQGRIATAADLAEIVEGAVARRGRTHPATKTFQALRIAVNDELGALEEFIPAALALLASGGRLSIISFHSTEDRLVKQAFREYEARGIATRIGKKPITPSDEERTLNPRARSAKLRTIEKL